MSDIRANTISDTSGNGPINLHKQSAAKAWVQANSSATVLASLNISSGTDAGVGNYRNGIINAMVDTDSLVYTVTPRTSNQNITGSADSPNITASQISTHIANASTGSFTSTLWNGLVHGDLA